MNLKALLSGTAISTVAIASAFAQTPARGPAPAPQPFTWTGFYVGGHVGSLTHTSTVADGNDWFGGFGVGATYDFSRTTTAFGVQGGFNWQWSWLVLGIEGDLTSAPSSRGAGFAFAGTHTTSAFTSMMTVRGRAGVAIDRLLLYGTGGFAEAHLINRVDDAANPFVAARNTRPTGAVFGAGVEYAFANNWTARVEYLRANFNDEMQVVGPPGGGTYQFVFHDSVEVVRAGLNFKF
jgi:outer membrane immunogenic protein